MCIIAAIPENNPVSRDTLERCFENNSDGAGFVVRRDNQLIASKGFFTFKEFYDAYEPYEKNTAIVHFRIKTHGNRDAAMCHPFEVLPNKLWVAHNGMIDIDTAADPTKSDTWHFVDLVLKPELEKDPGALRRSSFQFLLGCTIGHSKLAFLNNRGAITLINKHKGEMDGEVWYSNGTYKKPRVSAGYYTGTSTYVPTGGTLSKKHEGGSASNASGTGSSSSGGSRTTATKVYADLGSIPVSDRWILEVLREFKFSEEEILEEINAETATDMALDLLVKAAEREAEGVQLSPEEITEEVLLEKELEEISEEEVAMEVEHS